MTIVIVGAGQAADEGLGDLVAAQQGAQLRRVGDMGVDVGVGEHHAELFEHPLAPPHSDQPIVDDGDAHPRKLPSDMTTPGPWPRRR